MSLSSNRGHLYKVSRNLMKQKSSQVIRLQIHMNKLVSFEIRKKYSRAGIVPIKLFWLKSEPTTLFDYKHSGKFVVILRNVRKVSRGTDNVSTRRCKERVTIKSFREQRPATTE